MQNTEFRVFISSTFQDLQEEREHLVKKIFPEVRARCSERGVTFTEVDLRWGVTAEDVTSGSVIRTCLEEVDRSRPYFIGITGDRYGSIPKAADIAADPELIQKFPWVPDAIAEGASLIDLEFRHGALNQNVEDANTPRVFFYVRQRLWDRDSSAPERMKLSSLERRTKARGYKVSGYQSAEKLGEMIRAELLAILDRDFAKIVEQQVERESVVS
jgi:preprotein translocase subunit SecA/nephrocystin-3